MSTLLHLLSNYYKSVIECERVYNAYLLSNNRTSENIPENKEGERNKEEEEDGNVADSVTLQLQRQINKLTVQINSLSHENDKLKHTNKSIKSASETKINNLKKSIDKLKGEKSVEPRTDDEVTESSQPASRAQSKFHLLSPMGKKYQRSSSRQISHTIFDSDSNSDENNNPFEHDSFSLSLREEERKNKKTSYQQQQHNRNGMNKKKNGENGNNNISPRKRLSSLEIPTEDDFSKDTSTEVEVSHNKKRRKLSNKKIEKSMDTSVILPSP